MGLTPQLAATLLCLLVCAGNFAHGCNSENLAEIIHILNRLTSKGTPCTEMLVPDVFTETKNTTEEKILCRTQKVLRKFYNSHIPCLKNNTLVLKDLQKVYRIVCSMSQLRNCTVSESTQITLKTFLESLKRMMQKKQ
uniref:Interleukin-4 n=1 Tax=Nannospalax galili TaxID=1026970 RepID=A0A8C6QYB9_NANGA